MPAAIKQTVGKKAQNDPFDVTVVQKLLAAASSKLRKPTLDPKRSDGHIDTNTHTSIAAFESDVMGQKKPDGKIRPNGKVWNRLLKEAGEVDTNPTGYPVKPDSVKHLGDGGRDGIFSTFVITDKKKADYPGYKDNPGPTEADKDDIRILGKWEGKNIQSVEIPQLKTLGLRSKTRFHRLAIPQLLGLWQAWEHDGLLDRVVTFDGGFNSRYKRKTAHVTRNLSNHCWGSAFDINYAWNRLGKTPAIIWEKGCVFELVPLAVKWGFYWGGWFGGGREDGMHFEVRVLTNKELSP